MSQPRRVVVTGVGPVTPIGTGKEVFWNALVGGQSGVGQITLFDATDFPSRIAAEVKGFSVPDSIEAKAAKRMDRFTQFAVVAAQLALIDSGLEITGEIADRVGVIIGSGIGGLQTHEDQHTQLMAKGPRRVSPFLVPMMIPDMAAGQVAILFGARGPNYSTTSACASGAHGIGEGFEIIKRGGADAVIAGGTEAPITPLSVAAFGAMKALSTRNEEPEKASRPFDVDRDGFVIAEGAGVVILEELSFAEKRGARIYAEVVGYGATADAFHITQPDPSGRGAARAMSLALEEAEVPLEEVDYINAHGTSTPYNDEFETAAIKQVFGKHAYDLLVSSSKSMTGHMIGAAGGVELLICALAIENSIVPPTVNLDKPDPLCDLNYVPHTAVEKPVEVALSNSFGFGGHNACLVIKKFR